MNKVLWLAPCAALLFACSEGGNNGATNGGTANAAGGGTGSNGAAAAPGGSPRAEAPPAAAPGAAATLRPGQWETTARLVNIEAPGVPPQALEQLRNQMGRQRNECWTEAEVSNIAEKLANPSTPNANCEFGRRTFANGVIDVAGTCSSRGQQVQMGMTGSFTADTIEANVNVNTSGQGQSVRMTLAMNGRRIGECQGPTP